MHYLSTLRPVAGPPRAAQLRRGGPHGGVHDSGAFRAGCPVGLGRCPCVAGRGQRRGSHPDDGAAQAVCGERCDLRRVRRSLQPPCHPSSPLTACRRRSTGGNSCRTAARRGCPRPHAAAAPAAASPARGTPAWRGRSSSVRRKQASNRSSPTVSTPLCRPLTRFPLLPHLPAPLPLQPAHHDMPPWQGQHCFPCCGGQARSTTPPARASPVLL